MTSIPNQITRRKALATIAGGAAATAVAGGAALAYSPDSLAPVPATDVTLLKLVEQWHATWPRFLEAGRELWRVIQDPRASTLAGAEVGRLRTELDKIEADILSLEPQTERAALALASIPAAFWRDAPEELNNVAVAWTDRSDGTMPGIAMLAATWRSGGAS